MVWAGRVDCFLTEKGREQFPTRYIRLTVRLIEQLKEIMPQIALDQIFSQVAQSIASNYQAEADNLPMEERLKLVQGLLKNEGFNVELEQDGDFYHLREVSCPYFHVGQNHPEVCTVDQTLISTLLSIPAQKIACLLQGDAHCTYIIPKDLPTLEKPSS
jgi:predicted ArsR family transcriptional regulator